MYVCVRFNMEVWRCNVGGQVESVCGGELDVAPGDNLRSLTRDTDTRTETGGFLVLYLVTIATTVTSVAGHVLSSVTCCKMSQCNL